LALESIVLSGMTACAAALKQSGDSKPAQPPPHVRITAELTIVSDYRRNGVTQSDNNPALQGRIEVRHDSGFSAGAFATSMHGRRGSNAQVSLFGSRRFEFGETDVNLGGAAIIFIGGEADPFGVAQASVVHPIGPVDATLSVGYAPPQDAIDNEDGLNINLRVRTPLGRLNGVALTGGASVGHSEGEFAMGAETKLDWSAGVTAEIEGTEFGLAYVDNDLDNHRGEAGIVFSITRRF
jgi:uncharacterized protein (TIGR02001 family)